MRWIPEAQPTFSPWNTTILEWLTRSFRKLSDWSIQISGQLDGLEGIESFGATITFNAGDGTPHGDLNATDFTGDPNADPDNPTALLIKSNAVVTFGHNLVAYIWTGPSSVSVGVGGSHIAVATDLTPIGTADHNLLANRNLSDQHASAAITGLDAKQASQDAAITQNANDLAAHEAAPDPHPQYVLEGHGGIFKTTDTNYGTVGSGAWTTIDNWDEGMLFSPVGVTQDVANSGLRVTEQGAYKVTGTAAVSFNDTNQGRVFGVRLWNDTKSTAGRVVEYFVGRNQDGVNVSQGALLVEIGANEVNDLFQLQIAGVGDSFANVAVIDALFSLVRVK